MIRDTPRLGATHLGDGRTEVLLWAPACDRVDLLLDGRELALEPVGRGYVHAVVDGMGPGDRYAFRLHRDGHRPVERADPVSRAQPDGVHGPSAVVDEAFPWTDQGFRNPPLWRHVLYELHIGTFTPEGTFDGAIGRLGDLADLGVTAVEVMPIWQFPGERNWGYDGVFHYAVQHSYGGRDGLKRFVDAAHAHGIAVILDVVYNHFGPEGAHHRDFGPYLTDAHATPWGDAVNMDGPGSDEVRRYVVDNAVEWVTTCHVDGLRLDAVHAIRDDRATHLLQDLTTAVHRAAAEESRTVHVTAEWDHNDARLVRAPEIGGYGMDAVWDDDVHHVIHTLLTGEDSGYYGSYGDLEGFVDLLRERYAHHGVWSAYHGRTRGAPARDVPHHRFVACIQNHDQVGNRMRGERLTELVGVRAHHAAAAALLLSPFTPLLFMGEEHAAPEPFPYVIAHADPDLVTAVREGRAREFADFAHMGEPPDPAAEATFGAAVIDWARAADGPHAATRQLYQALLRARREIPALADPAAGEPEPTAHPPAAVWWRRTHPQGDATVVVNLGADPVTIPLPRPPGELRLDSTAWSDPADAVRLDGTSVTLAGHAAALFTTPPDPLHAGASG